MTNQIPFNYIPQNFRVPGTYVEVNASQANTSQQTLVALMIGQVTNGSLGPTVVNTSAVTASGTTLHFTSVPAAIVPGMNVSDITSATIAAGTTVISTASTTVTISQAVTGGGPGSGDHIQFSPPIAPILISTLSQASALFGPSSMLYNQCVSYRANDTLGALYALPLIDDPNSVAATGTITVTGTVSASYVLSLYIAGVPVPVRVTSGMTNAQIAVAVAAAINLIPTLPVTASGSTFPITLTANNAGAAGNDIDCRVNYYGTQNNEITPPGLTFTFSGMTGGATNPSLTLPLASLGEQAFDLISSPYIDTTSLNAFETFLNDSTGRWSYLQQVYGHYFTVANNTVGNLTTLGAGRNDQHTSILGIHGSPTPPFAIAAALTAQAAVSFRANPTLPLQTLPLVGVLSGDSFTISEREGLYFTGISASKTAADGSVHIDRVVTTYITTNSYPDDSYLQVERMFLISYAARYLISQLSSKYARVALANDGTRIPQGSNIVTPKVVRGEVISVYGDLVDLGYCQNFDQFVQQVIVQRNLSDPNRLDILFPADFTNQLIVTAISLSFQP